MKQQDNLAVDRVNASQVWSFVPVTAITSQGQVVESVAPTVLLRDYVFDMVSEPRVFLMQPAVFTPIIRPASDQSPRRGIHSIRRWFEAAVGP
jgi:hypothetical protein